LKLIDDFDRFFFFYRAKEIYRGDARSGQKLYIFRVRKIRTEECRATQIVLTGSKKGVIYGRNFPILPLNYFSVVAVGEYSPSADKDCSSSDRASGEFCSSSGNGGEEGFFF